MAGVADGTVVQMGAKIDFSTVSTDMYNMVVRVRTVEKDGSGNVEMSEELTTTVDRGVVNHRPASTGGSIPLNRPDAGLGAGWSYAGLKQIKEREDGVWYTPGDGKMYWFREDGSGYESPRGFYSTLVKESNGEFTLTDRYGYSYTFHSSAAGQKEGFLKEESDRNSRSLTYTYDGSSRLTTITDRFGQTVEFNYDGGGTLTSVKGFDGIVYPVQIDNDILTSVDSPDPDGTGSGQESLRRYFTYDSNGELSSVELRDRSYSGGSVVETSLEKTEYLRDAFGDPNAIRKTDYIAALDANGQPVNEQWTWDKNTVSGQSGMVNTKNGGGSATSPAQPLRLWASSQASPGGLSGNTELPDSTQNAYEYDWRGDIVSEGIISGGSTTTTCYAYNQEGLPLTVVLPEVTQNGVTQKLRYEYIYDEDSGNLEELHEIAEEGSSTTSRVWSWTYGVNSQVTSATDEFGRVTTFTLDTWGNATTITEPDPDGAGPLAAPVTSITYFAPANARAGFISYVTEPDPDGTGSLLAPQTQYQYDDKGHLERILRRTPSSGTTTVNQEIYNYVVSGAPTDQLQYVRDPPRTADSGQGNRISYSSYNALNLPRVVTEAPSKTDEKRITTYTYDGFGRIIRIVQQDADDTGPLPAAIYDYTYDGRGNLIQTLGPEVTVVLPDNSTTSHRPKTTYLWDDRGQLVSLVDPLGNETTFDYDERGNLIEETSPDPDDSGSRTATVVTYTWDARDRMTSRTVTDGTGTLAEETYEYDAFDRLIKVTDELRDASTQYAHIGNDLEVTDARGAKTYYDYDNLDRLIRVL